MKDDEPDKDNSTVWNIDNPHITAIGPNATQNITNNNYSNRDCRLPEPINTAKFELVAAVLQRSKGEQAFLGLIAQSPMPVRWTLSGRTTSTEFHTIFQDGDSFDFTVRSDKPAELCRKYVRLRRRRLVILGEPGSGKTVLAELLQREILRGVDSGYPVPIYLSLSQWDIQQHPTLNRWLAYRLKQDFPGVWRAIDETAIQGLIDNDLILPVLDGLDEVNSNLLPEVYAAIRSYLASHDSFIMTSRPNTYVSLVEELGKMSATAVIESEALAPDSAAEYLEKQVDGTESWSALLAVLRSGRRTPIAEVCASPLGLWLLQSTYSTREERTLKEVPTPNELLDRARFPDSAAIKTHLFSQLIPAVLRKPRIFREVNEDKTEGYQLLPSRSWSSVKAERWLGFLSRTDSVKVWDLPVRQKISAQTMASTAEVVGGMCAFIAAVNSSDERSLSLWPLWITALGFALPVYVLAKAFASGQDEPSPIVRGGFIAAGRAMLTKWRSVGEAFLAFAALGVITGVVAITPKIKDVLAYVFWTNLNLPKLVWSATAVEKLLICTAAGLVAGLAATLIGAASTWLKFWLAPPAPGKYCNHNCDCTECLYRREAMRSVWKSSRRVIVDARLRVSLSVSGNVFLLALFGTFVFGLFTAMRQPDEIVGLSAGERFIDAGVVGLSMGLPIAIPVAISISLLSERGWLHFAIVSRWLAMTGQLPWRTLDFLEDMIRVGLLRPSGAELQFRHAELRQYLLEADSKDSAA